MRRTAAARKARPRGVAPQEDAQAATAAAWEALGFADGEDDIEDFVAGSDEDEGGDGSGSDGDPNPNPKP